MFNFALIVWLLFCMAVPHSFADNGCTNPQTTYDRTYCMAKLFIEADTEMGKVYKDLMKALKPEQKTKLVQAQRHWILFRNNACEKAGTINVACNYQVLRDRMQFLSDRLRECKTGYCREDLMFQENWQAPPSPHP